MSKQNAVHADCEQEDKPNKYGGGVAMRKYVLNQKAYSSWYGNDSLVVKSYLVDALLGRVLLAAPPFGELF
jgi:hypothetical protein